MVPPIPNAAAVVPIPNAVAAVPLPNVVAEAPIPNAVAAGHKGHIATDGLTSACRVGIGPVRSIPSKPNTRARRQQRRA